MRSLMNITISEPDDIYDVVVYKDNKVRICSVEDCGQQSEFRVSFESECGFGPYVPYCKEHKKRVVEKGEHL
jgi:hypothetical protein